jgi:hypothetical protein
MTIQILPDHSRREITLDGFAVPRVSVQEISATGQWNVIFDGRFCVLADDLEEVNRWIPMIANVQAVAEGYSCHGDNSVYRPNPHQVRVMCIEAAGE